MCQNVALCGNMLYACYSKNYFHLLRIDQSVENAAVAFVKGAVKERISLKKINNQYCMTNKCGQTRQRINKLIWGMNSASELAIVYYYTRRSIRGGSQSTLPGDKAWCIVAPLERYSGYRHYQ